MISLRGFFNFIVITALGLLPLTWSGALWADGASSVGIIGGMSVPDAENTNPHQLFGVRGFAYMMPTITLGGYYMVSQKEEGTNGRKFQYSLHGIEGAYHIPNGTGETFFALRAGLSKVRTQTGSTDLIYSPYHLGVALGYDYFLTSWMLIGFEGSYFQFQRSETNLSGTNYTEDPFNIMCFLVSAQFRF